MEPAKRWVALSGRRGTTMDWPIRIRKPTLYPLSYGDRGRGPGAGALGYSEPSTGQRDDLPFQAIAQPVLLDLEVVASLKVEPEPLGGAEVLRQPQRCVRRNGPVAVNDLVDSPSGNADVLGDPVLADSHRLEELLEEDLTGVYGPHSLCCHSS